MPPVCITPGCDRPSRSPNARSEAGRLCPTCRTKAWRKKNPEKNRLLGVKNSRRRQAKYRTWLDSVKTTQGCTDCGYSAHPAALDFDHLPGSEKLFILARGANQSRERVLAEMEKCEVVCANCHRVRTANRRKSQGPPEGLTAH